MRTYSLSLLFVLTAACGGFLGDKVGTADVSSDDVNGVNATPAKFAFFSGVASNGLDIDDDGADDDSTAVVFVLLSDRETACDELNEALLTGDSEGIDLGLEGTSVIIAAVKRTLNAESNLLSPESFLGDGGDVTVNIGFSVLEGGVFLAQTSGDELGRLDLTANDDNTFNGDFSGLMIEDASGQAPFDLDTDGDGVLDATSINASISGSFEKAQLCAGLEGIAFFLSVFAGL